MTPFAMLYTIAAGVPIAWAALALAAVLRRYGRPERGVWLAALVLALVAPAVVLLDLFGTPVVPTAPPVVGVIGLPEFVVIPVPESSMDFGELVLIAWLLVSTGLAARWGVAAYRLAQASRSWQPGTIDGVSVWMTEDVGPAVSGVFRPKVLAPSWLHTLPGSQRALVLMHEEEHVRAHDPLVIAFTRLARILAPWNPVVWLLSSRLVRAVELDCDRRVLRRTSDVAAYGHTLLTVSERRPGHLIAAAAFAESEAPLRTRILNMTTPPRAISLAAIGAATVLGVVLLAGACQIPVPAVSVDESIGAEPDQTPTVTQFDAPPLPPSAPPAPDVVVGAAPPPAEVVVGVTQQDSFLVRFERGEIVEVMRRDGTPLSGDELREVLPNIRRLDGGPRPVISQPFAAAPTGAATSASAAQQVPEPGFTPMTVRPALANVPEVQEALLREYPAVLRDAGVGGAPVLWIHISATGAVDATRVHESSGTPALDAAAQAVARTMRFTPARNVDEVVAVWVQIPVRFAVVN